MKLQVRDPYSQSSVGETAWASDTEIKVALERATKAFQAWRHSRSQERADLLNQVASELEARKEEFAQLMRQEAGKPITYARVEVDRCLGVLRWAANESLRFGGEVMRLDTTKAGRAGFGILSRFPRGLILGITPFNFPLNLVAHKVAPALASGNVILVKPSPATPLTALKFAELFSKHVPGLFQVVVANDKQTAELTKANEIAMVSFTGSARVGWLIREQAPRKPVTLELGGNAWCYIADDVPPSEYAAIAKRIAGAAFGYAGQSCISIQNVAVAQTHWEQMREALSAATQAAAFGDPSQDKVIAGPVINEAAAKRIAKEIGGGGGTVVRSSAGVGSENPQVVTPSLVLEPKLESSLVQEEIFGPVMTAHRSSSFDEFVSTVNKSRYGLQAGIYTQNYALIEKAYRELEVGGVIVNDVPTTRYDHQPYGGIKDSGMGREGLEYAMEEMTEPKFLALSSIRPL